ncbi:MAG: PAS domain S-box protein [Bacteroidetes bacterium]|nr:PAS domain S-box protein [Bacteroidota bacterium]MBS1541470.1 PAS domain S-box protein [Bacteroidota bacterium]
MENNLLSKLKIRLSIGNKIFSGFTILIVLFAINALIIFMTINTINKNVEMSSQVVNPSKDAINELVTLVHRSRMLITNWVFLQTNDDDKKALQFIISHEYKVTKEKIEKLMKSWDADSTSSKFKKDSSQRTLMTRAFGKYDSLLSGAQINIINTLSKFEDYDDPTKKLLAGDYVDQTVIPESNKIIGILSAIKSKQESLAESTSNTLIQSTGSLRLITIGLGLAIVVIGFLSATVLVRTITRPINYIKDVVVKLGRGELVDDKKTKFSNDEIGEMAIATDSLVNGLKATTLFAENIGNGKYDSEFSPLSNHDVLGNALLNMRSNLARVAEEDKKRNWTTEGLAKFGEILRGNSSDVQKLSDEIIGNLVKYLKANQGALYIVDDTSEGQESSMSMVACYAWNKKKYINQKILIGEGLTGQCWQEGDVIYLTDVPQNYIRITSGLGDANPNALLVVPLKVNEQIFGVVEVASFGSFKEYEIDFVKRIAESIASTISSVKINARTQRLLSESQQMTEEMRAQEEEMRQNMEELQATQEEMQRNQSEASSAMEAINSSTAMADFDAEGNIITANTNYLKLFGYSLDEVKGENHKILVPRDDRGGEAYRKFWKDLSSGKSQRGEYKGITKFGKEVWLLGQFNPVLNRDGEVTKVTQVVLDITAIKG